MNPPPDLEGANHLPPAVDLVVIGGGIVGLAAAYRIGERFPALSIAVLEKEPGVGRHQSGRNSGVLHSGIYYEPGSLRAQICRAGKQEMEEFCRTQSLPYEVCGKVIVAVNAAELPALDRILERGHRNGVRCERIGAEHLRDIEPHTAGIAAIHVPDAGIVDYVRVCERLAHLVGEHGGHVVANFRVTAIEAHGDRVVVRGPAGEITAKRVINCAGLYSDRVARLSGQKLGARIVPFRGEYWQLVPAAQHLCRNLIYPVPDARFPFLGVHFTRMVQGGVECGPNAVFAFAREGYGKLDVNGRDLLEALGYAGFRRLAARHWRKGLDEFRRSFSKPAFVRALQRLVPAIRSEHLVPCRAGVRAQALAPDGELIHDFVLEECGRVLNVCNAPSPAATSSLRIGTLIADRLAPRILF